MKYRFLAILLFAVQIGFGQIYIDSYRFAVAGPSDPFFSSVSLLLHMEGANNSTTFTDDSNYGFTVTPSGNAKISTSQFKYGASSGLFDGSGDYLTVNTNTAFDYGSGDFTIEFWMRPSVVTGGLFTTFSQISGVTQPSGIVSRIFNSKISFNFYNTTNIPQFVLGDVTTLTANTWYHVAVTKSGNTYRLFLNGNLEGNSATTTSTVFNGKNVVIGAWTDYIDLRDFNGYIDDFRITKGVARYTSNFTPPAAQFPDN